MVDNASRDGTVARARPHAARVLENSRNVGFAGGVNQGLKATRAACVLILNPDVTLRSPLEPLLEACRQGGLAAGQLTDARGAAQAGFTIRRFPTPAALALELLGINRLWPRNSSNRHYRYLDRDLNQAGTVDQPAGAFLAIRHDVWDKLGGFDENFYPVWFEDVDFCKRAVRAGYRILYVPEVKARHIGGHSVRRISVTQRDLYWYDSLLRYAEKHFAARQYKGVCLAAVLSVFPRAVLSMIRERSYKPIITSFRILNLAGRRLVSRRMLAERLTQRLGRDTQT